MNPWYGNSMGGGMMSGTYGLDWIIALIFAFFFFVLIIVGAVLFVWWATRKPVTSIQTNGSLGILKERYAKGEITKDQYEQIKKDLGG